MEPQQFVVWKQTSPCPSFEGESCRLFSAVARGEISHLPLGASNGSDRNDRDRKLGDFTLFRGHISTNLQELIIYHEPPKPWKMKVLAT